MRVLQTPPTLRNALFLPYKEGVAGSNPASPTTFFLQIAVFFAQEERVEKCLPALLLQPE
jgi:hypothetical protein